MKRIDPARYDIVAEHCWIPIFSYETCKENPYTRLSRLGASLSNSTTDATPR